MEGGGAVSTGTAGCVTGAGCAGKLSVATIVGEVVTLRETLQWFTT